MGNWPGPYGSPIFVGYFCRSPGEHKPNYFGSMMMMINRLRRVFKFP